MKHNRIRTYSILFILAMFGFILFPVAMGEDVSESDSKNNEPDISQELSIMSKVFEESLNRTSLKNEWKGIPLGTSVFDPVIKSQYIPSVGAIFTIPVSFLIVEPATPSEEEKAEEKSEKEEADLWEKFSEEKGRHEEFRAQMNSYSMDPMIDHAVQEKMKDLQGQLEHAEKVKKIAGRTDLPVFVSDASIPPAPYKKEQFDILRDTILAVLAQYGHHLKSVKDSERILVVVEAPSSQEERTAGDPMRLLKTQRKVEYYGSERLGVPMGPVPAVSVFGISAHYSRKDRCLIAVVKGNIQGEKDPMDLGGKIEEIFY